MRQLHFLGTQFILGRLTIVSMVKVKGHMGQGQRLHRQIKAGGLTSSFGQYPYLTTENPENYTENP